MKKRTAVIFTVIFLILTIGLGIFSFANLMKYYINDDSLNNEWNAESGNKFETDISGTFYKNFSFVNLNGAIRRVLGQREMNGVVKLNNGYLTEPLPECSEETLKHYAYRVSEFNEYLKKRGTSLVYVSPPYTSSKYDPELPSGIEDFSNANIDHFLEILDIVGVETIDLRETMASDGIDHYSMMYKTDHHWKTEAGFYAYGILEKYIADKTGCEIDPKISHIENYTVTNYEKSHLGTRGLRTGIYYAGIDDFTQIAPNFDTLIEDPYGVVGTIQDSFIKMEPFTNPDYTTRYTYDTALGRSAYIGHYKNLQSVNDVKVMIISDSFSKAVNPYLIMEFSEVNCFVNGFVGGITPEVIEDYDPDVVIMLYYPKFISDDGGPFDFRGYAIDENDSGD